MNHKRKKRKIKTNNGYLPGDGPRGNSKQDQSKQETIDDLTEKEQMTCAHKFVNSVAYMGVYCTRCEHLVEDSQL